MAKVYDALKQVEAERSRQLRSAEAARVVSRPEPTFWKRFSGRFAARNGEFEESGASPSVDHAVHERMDTILGRLDAFENLAAKKIPELERNLLQLLEGRIDTVERELAASVAALGNQMRNDAAVLHKRVTLFLGAVLILLAAVLLRG